MGIFKTEILEGAGDIAHLVKYLPAVHESLGSAPAAHKLDEVACACQPRPPPTYQGWRVEAE